MPGIWPPGHVTGEVYVIASLAVKMRDKGARHGPECRQAWHPHQGLGYKNSHFWLWALRLRIEMVYCFKVELGRRMGEEGNKERKWWCGCLACRVQGSWLQWNAGGDNACGRTLHPTLRSNAEKGIRCAPIIRWWCVRAPSYHTENWHISLFFNYTFRKG